MGLGLPASPAAIDRTGPYTSFFLPLMGENVKGRPPMTLSWQALDRSGSFLALPTQDRIKVIETDHASCIA
jgi:hypothetical protein